VRQGMPLFLAAGEPAPGASVILLRNPPRRERPPASRLTGQESHPMIRSLRSLRSPRSFRPLRRLLALGLLPALFAPPLAATCGGGGGGGMGGVRGGGGGGSTSGAGGTRFPGRDIPGGQPAIYLVPWNVVHNGEAVPAPLAAPAGAPVDNLVIYWFPTSAQEAKSSELQASHDLTLLTARCVTLALVASDNAELRGR